VADDVAQGGLVEQRRRFALARGQGADAGKMPGQPMGRADKEMAGAHSRVTYLEGENSLLGLSARLAFDGLLHHRVEGGVEQALHQRVGRVVGAGGLALVAGELGEPMGDLYNPEVSIRYGSWYLKGLLDKYNGNLDLALAAYNAGVPRADKYKDKVMPLPYETVFFVQKVKGAEGMYDKVHDAWYSKSQSEKRNPVTVGFANLGDFVKKLILGNK